MDDLARDRRTLNLFAAERLNKGTNAQPAQPVFLLIDQFEELFTLCREEAEKQAFIDNLMTAATEPGGGFFIVITLRADFYGHCAPYAALRDLLALEQIYIGPMTAGRDAPRDRGTCKT